MIIFQQVWTGIKNFFTPWLPAAKTGEIGFYVAIDEDRLRELEDIRKITGLDGNRELFNNSLTLFKWAVTQKQQGRSIISTDNFSDERELSMDCLDRIECPGPINPQPKRSRHLRLIKDELR
jgi:hypothetical protein